MDRFFSAISKSLIEHSRTLKCGKAFGPADLKKRKLTKYLFPPVVKSLARQLDLELHPEEKNKFPKEFDVGKRQMVDYVIGDRNRPTYFLEVESLNRAQLYLFLADGKKGDASKLWYYWGTVFKKILDVNKEMPRYFVFLLILPDEPIGHFPFWDATKKYKLFNMRLRKLAQDNPFRFYDGLIKTSARLFLDRYERQKYRGKWYRFRLQEHQNKCELVILTCTGHQLIMSRGRDRFDPAKERRVPLQWKET